MSLPILKTKLLIPPPRQNIVLRPRLIEKLDTGLSKKLTILSAPAGFGKTTLLSAWVRELESGNCAWLSLDQEDNDFPRFIVYFVSALQTIESHVGAGALGAFSSSGSQNACSMLTSLITDIAESDKEWVMILDDYHFIESTEIHESLNFLIHNLPINFHLVISTRDQPPLAIPQLRAKGMLTELRFRDMKFTDSETSLFFNQVMGLDLPSGDIALLKQKTEGWVAGMQLAAIALQEAPNKKDFIETFSGSHHFIIDYLLEEILEQQPERIQDFLMKTSVLKYFNVDLCSSVTGFNDSFSILSKLEMAGMFLIPLDGERCWFRYHHLFSDFLKTQLEQRESRILIQDLHKKSSAWHQTNGSLEEAMFHAIAAKDFETAAKLIEENIAGMFMNSEVPLLLEWIRKIPGNIIQDHPWIDIFRANTLALASQVDDIDPLLEGIENRINPENPDIDILSGHITAIRTFVANLRGDGDLVIQMAEQTRKQLSDQNSIAWGMASYALADTFFARDDMDGASRELQAMFAAGQESGQLMISVPALCDLAAVRKVQGTLNQAEALYEKAHQLMITYRGLDSRVRCSYEFGLADLLCERNELDQALEHVNVGMAYRQRLGGYLLVGELVLMRILQARGDMTGAKEALAEAEKQLLTYPFQMAVTLEFKIARVKYFLAIEDVETARLYANSFECVSEQEGITWARIHLAQEDAERAQRLLVPLRKAAEDGSRKGRLVEILGLLAITKHLQGQNNEAMTILSQAISIARPEGYRRIFLDMGKPLFKLIRLFLSVDTAHEMPSINLEYLHALNNACIAQKQTASNEKSASMTSDLSFEELTDREKEVLRLLARGFTNKHIASELIVAPSTIKQHLKNIFGKLQVHNRTEAVARGQELNIL